MRKICFWLQDGKVLICYVLPSMFSMFIAGIYTIVDGLFVGWGTGSHG